MQTKESLERLICACAFRDWSIRLRWDEDRPYVQIFFMERDEFSGEVSEQACRKWFLSLHMCDTEVVDTVYASVERAMLHEVREQFKFMGKRIYNPHRNVYKLVEAASGPDCVDTRAKPATCPEHLRRAE